MREELRPIDVLHARLKGKTQVAVAKELGITPAYLSDMLSGRRALSNKVVAALGLKKVVAYRAA